MLTVPLELTEVRPSKLTPTLPVEVPVILMLPPPFVLKLVPPEGPNPVTTAAVSLTPCIVMLAPLLAVTAVLS